MTKWPSAENGRASVLTDELLIHFKNLTAALNPVVSDVVAKGDFKVEDKANLSARWMHIAASLGEFSEDLAVAARRAAGSDPPADKTDDVQSPGPETAGDTTVGSG